MITIHHLGVSQSDRVVWLMEELGLPYELVWHRRGPNGLMPQSYVDLHPAATAPVIEDDGRRLTESAVICEYICHKYAGGRMTVTPSNPAYPDYLYFMHLNNNLLGLFFARLALGDREGGVMGELLKRREDGYARMAEQALGRTLYLAGDELTCADIMSVYTLRSPRMLGARDDLPGVKAWLARIAERPAYQKAEAIAGDKATPPAGS